MSEELTPLERAFYDSHANGDGPAPEMPESSRDTRKAALATAIFASAAIILSLAFLFWGRGL